MEPQEQGSVFSGQKTDVQEQQQTPRFLLNMVEAEPLEQSLQPARGSVFLITDDEAGLAQALAEELRQLGAQPVLVQAGDSVKEIAEGRYQTNFEVPESAAELVRIVRRHGPLAGIIHLLPLKGEPDFVEMQLADWRAWLRQNVKGLFYLVQAAGDDLKKAAEADGGWVLSAISSGGTIGYLEDVGRSCFPGRGGIIGLVNTIATEWLEVQCKVVSIEKGILSSILSSHLLREMAAKDGNIEVGYKNKQRYLLGIVRKPLSEESPQALDIDSDWVIMITGGARGITAEVALALAEQYSPSFVLVGRSAAPPEEELPETAELTSPGEIKRALIEQFKRSGRQINLGEVEAAYGKICREREIRKNLTAMEKAGAKVRYVQTDVCDESSFAKTIDSIYSEYGRLDGVIHGAGIIEDKLLESKLPASFDRVFDTKTDSAFILSHALRPDSLKFLVFFSSIASFGNRGQCDYAAANEVLNKVAVSLDRQWSGRILSALWGPWAKTGMASSEVQRKFAERGIQLVQPTDGRRWLEQELRLGRKGDVAIVFGSGPWESLGREKISFQDHLPLLEKIHFVQSGNSEVIADKTLDPASDIYLNDHVVDKNPVLPMVMAMELMSEIVQYNWPEMHVTSVHSLQVLRGIVIDKGSKDIRIHARPKQTIDSAASTLEVEVEITEPNGKGHPPFYKCVVMLEKNKPAPPAFDATMFANLQPFSLSVKDSYQRWLFHGPCFQGITAIKGINEQIIRGTLKSISPAICLAQTKETREWLFDPVILDSSLQLVILWERNYHDMTPLPSRIDHFHKYGPLAPDPVHCYVQVKSSNQGQTIKANIFFLDKDNRLLAVLEGVEVSSSQVFNRLTEKKQTYVAR